MRGSGRPLNLIKASATAKAANTAVMSIQIQKLSIKKSITLGPAAPARYKNCFKVSGPTILGETSIN